MSPVHGVRPIETRISSASNGWPSSTSTCTAPLRDTEVTDAPSRTSTPPSRSAASTCSLANRSSRSISRSPRWTSVTREPSDDQACAISTPTTPPPRIASRGGTRFAVVASMFVQGAASASPARAGSPPRCRSRSRRRAARRAPRRRPRRASRPRAAVAADERDAALLEPRDHRRVVQVVDDLVAPREDGLDVELARPRRRERAAPRLRARPGRSSAFDGMHA